MKMKTSLAAAFLAFAGAAAATTAGAQQAPAAPGAGNAGQRGPGQRFERLDTDDSGSISFEEFAAAMGGGRMQGADADADGTLTVEEIAAQLQKEHFRRRAERMIRRLDTDGNGKLTTAEIESRQKKVFALADRDDSGAIEADEMRRGGREGRGRGGPRQHRQMR